ncbi:Armadillo-like helical [Fusarium coicis]|nr:Armadillo-like helical [Fusarium coicis]
MGFFDSITNTFNRIAEVAASTVQQISDTAEQIRRKFEEETRKAAEAAAQGVLEEIGGTAEAMCRELEGLIPSFDDKLEEVKAEITELASSAANDGVDITEAVNAAIDIAVQKVEAAKTAAIKAVSDFIAQAQQKLFSVLQSIIPSFLNSWTQWLEERANFLTTNLVNIGAKLVDNGISLVLQKIKVMAQTLVKKVGEVLGPIWGFIKRIWKLLFGEPPEQCELAMQWMEERMRRTQRQMIYKRSVAPITAVIRQNKFFELLPPDEESWKKALLDYLTRSGSPPGWRACCGRIKLVIQSTNPKPGSMVQLTWDDHFTDELKGQQRTQISIVYFRWKTEEFRKVSSGFIGILAMVSAVDVFARPYEPPPVTEAQREEPLQIAAVTMKKIYDELAPHMRLLSSNIEQDSSRFTGPKKVVSRQLKFRDDDGVWRTADIS